MDHITEMIWQKYGDLCRFCPPLAEDQLDKAKRTLPADLYEEKLFADSLTDYFSDL